MGCVDEILSELSIHISLLFEEDDFKAHLDTTLTFQDVGQKQIKVWSKQIHLQT